MEVGYLMRRTSESIFDAVAERIDAEAGNISARQWLVLSGVGLVSVLSLWGSTLIPATSQWRTFVTAIGTGLLISAVFAFIQRMVTGRTEQRAQARYLAAFSEALAEEIRSEVTRLQRDVPTNNFPSSPSPDPVFNEVLMRDVQGTPFYWFRGYSARFLAARLRQGTTSSCQVHAILPDPRLRDSLNLRLSYVSKTANNGVSSEEESLRIKIVEDLRKGLVGLFLARHQVSSIEIILTRTPGQDRLELLGPALWITLFSGQGESAPFPRSIRYSSDSTVYKMHVSECAQVRESPHVEKYEINRNTDEASFREFYTQVTGTVLDDDGWRTLCDGYMEFEQQFLLTSGIQVRR